MSLSLSLSCPNPLYALDQTGDQVLKGLDFDHYGVGECVAAIVVITTFFYLLGYVILKGNAKTYMKISK